MLERVLVTGHYANTRKKTLLNGWKCFHWIFCSEYVRVFPIGHINERKRNDLKLNVKGNYMLLLENTLFIPK